MHTKNCGELLITETRKIRKNDKAWAFLKMAETSSNEHLFNTDGPLVFPYVCLSVCWAAHSECLQGRSAEAG